MIKPIFSSVWSIVLFLLMICLIIAIHELGHLIAAKKSGVYCYEYSIGFGPIIYSNKKHETHFNVRAVPLGGFVRMAGEEGQDGDILDNNGNVLPKERLMNHVSPGKRILIMAAGGIMNMILAILSFYVYIAFNHGFAIPKDDNRISVATEGEYVLVNEDIKTGDKIIKIESWLNDSQEHTIDDNVKKFVTINSNLNETMPLEVNDIQHIIITYTDGNETKTITTSRKKESEESMTMLGLGQYVAYYEYNALTATYGSFHFLGINIAETAKAFVRIFTGDFANLSGLVGIYEVVDDVAHSDDFATGRLVYLIYLMGAISFSLGFFNLIPFPALDGGRIVFVLIELITRKKVKPEIEASIHSIGLILLFILMIVVNVKDIIGIFR